MVAIIDEERVLLVVQDDVLDGRERQHPHHVVALRGGVDVEVLAAIRKPGGREGGREEGEK